MNHRVTLRSVRREVDLPIFFEQQLDPLANTMAAFTAKDPADRKAFDDHWDRILSADSITARTILVNGAVAGHIGRFEHFGLPEITYWLGRAYWGKGIATEGLALFLEEIRERPLYARVAKDNVASLRVLEKCGFKITGEDRGFANARGQEVEEFILKLEAAGQAEP
jgi:RimJ/RimL family protein N-acetyltransferase